MSKAEHSGWNVEVRTIILKSCLTPQRSGPWHPATECWGLPEHRWESCVLEDPSSDMDSLMLLHRHLSMWTPIRPMHWLLLLLSGFPSAANNKWCPNLYALSITYHPIYFPNSSLPTAPPSHSNPDRHWHTLFFYPLNYSLFSARIDCPPSNPPSLSLLYKPALNSHFKRGSH